MTDKEMKKDDRIREIQEHKSNNTDNTTYNYIEKYKNINRIIDN